jgi:DNA-directed RNA polymerase subunit M/transcription elongation factor TFIIS
MLALGALDPVLSPCDGHKQKLPRQGEAQELKMPDHCSLAVFNVEQVSRNRHGKRRVPGATLKRADNNNTRACSRQTAWSRNSKARGADSQSNNFYRAINYSGVRSGATSRRGRGHPARHERESAKAVRL